MSDASPRRPGISLEWLERMASEDDGCISVGGLAADLGMLEPPIENSKMEFLVDGATIAEVVAKCGAEWPPDARRIIVEAEEEIRSLQAARDTALEACRAALEYDAALQRVGATIPDHGAAVVVVDHPELDALYARWIDAAQVALAPGAATERNE